ncbi:nitroreductase family protein [Maribellus maritimus]|uniref:nitroreductase family protein n=1 Tax=Maribellus maritimus TaxID=2870838 RepID=UPI001EEBF152|nr:nitroreductase family protein [Maribellus maritimus]MCG6188493.1 nitroreductase family protein [Maribellus maritimus]
MDLINVLNWRYAVKKFNKEKVSEKNVSQIISAISLSASSTGIQPYRIFVISNKDIRQELAKESFNPQITEASHLLAFAAFDSVTKERIANLIQLMASERGIPEDNLEDYKNTLEFHLLGRTNEENFIWSSKQAYIALGTGLIAAANLKVDATPMEGFNTEKLDDLLNLKEQGLRSVLLMALGYRDAEKDFLANQKKVRLPISDLVVEIG